MKESVKKQMAPVADALSAPFVLPAAILLKLIRKYGVEKLPLCRRIFDRVGVFPIQRHYHEPLFRAGELRTSLRDDRQLPGIDFNIDEQLALLERFGSSS